MVFKIKDPGGGGVVNDAVSFDGTNDYLTRGAALTGVTDSSTGTLSCWIRLDGGNAARQYITTNDTAGNDFFRIIRESNNRFNCFFSESTSTNQYAVSSATTYTAGASWINLLFSWNMNAGAGAKTFDMYINGANDKGSVSDAGAAFSIDYTRSNWSIGADTAGAQKLNASLYDFWLLLGTRIDFTVQANREKFILAGAPVNLGLTGELPTGSAPTIFQSGALAAWPTNKGTGGGFTLNGELTVASTKPA